MKKIITICFLCFLFLSQHVFAKTVYIEAKQYLDVVSGKLVQPANIVVKDGKITAINPATPPKNAEIISKPNLTLLPGLMDAHVHLTCDLTRPIGLTMTVDGAGMSTLRGAANAKKILMAGFTTVRDLAQCYPGVSFVTVDLAKASEEGLIDAPHIIPAGHALSITGGHIDFDMFGPFAPGVLPVGYRTGVADGPYEVTKAARYQIKHGAKVIKAAATAGVLSEEGGVANQQFSADELKAIVDEAHRHGIPVAVHAHGTEGINASIKAGVDSVEHGSLVNDESIRLMKEKGTYLVPTTYILFGMDVDHLSPVAKKKAEFLIPRAKQNLSRAFREHVKVVFGTDSGVYPHGLNAREFTSLTTLGMSPINAIRAATVNAAQLFKLKDRGQIKVGYDADIIGVTQDPLTHIKTLEAVKFVMKGGRIYKG